MHDQSAVTKGQHPAVVERTGLKEFDRTRLHGARIDRRIDREHVEHLPAVGQEPLPFHGVGAGLGRGAGPGVADARGGDPVGQPPPGAARVVAGEPVEGVGVDEPAPLHRAADPDRPLPGRRPEHRHAAVGSIGRTNRIDEIQKRQPRPGPGHGLVKQFAVTGEFVADRECPHEMGRGQDVGRVQRHLPGLGAAGHAVRVGRAEPTQCRDSLVD